MILDGAKIEFYNNGEEIFQLDMEIADPNVPAHRVNIMKARKLKLEDDVLKLNTN